MNKTNKNYKRSQRGRSMVEMLGVLAIVGTLSVGGVYGYGVAMKKHKANELLHQASMLATTISAQIQSKGELPTTIEDFGNGKYGTFKKPEKANDEQFKMEITGMDSAVCEQVAKMAGGMVRQAVCNGTTLTLTYNNDMSMGKDTSADSEGDKTGNEGEGTSWPPASFNCIHGTLHELEDGIYECACQPGWGGNLCDCETSSCLQSDDGGYLSCSDLYTWANGGFTEEDCNKCAEMGTPRKIFEEEYCGRVTCPTGTYQDIYGSCRPCSEITAYDIGSKQELCQQCDDTPYPRKTFYADGTYYCGLANCPEATDIYGSCQLCSDTSAYYVGSKQELCQQCDDTPYPRKAFYYEYIDDQYYCGLTDCPEGTERSIMPYPGSCE